MAFIYDVTELCAALKPFLLHHLLFDRGEPAVTYLDPDIEVFAPIDDLDVLARGHGIVLTPHRLDPVPDDGCQPDAHDLRMSGGVQPRLHRRRPGQPEPSSSAGPTTAAGTASSPTTKGCSSGNDGSTRAWSRSPTTSSTTPGATSRTGTWTRRPVTFGADGHCAAGWPLRFFHYSGFDPYRPYVLSTHQGDRPRILLSAQPALAALVGDTRRRLLAEAEGAKAPGSTAGPARPAVGDRPHHATSGTAMSSCGGARQGPCSAGDELPNLFDEPDDEQLLAILADTPTRSAAAEDRWLPPRRLPRPAGRPGGLSRPRARPASRRSTRGCAAADVSRSRSPPALVPPPATGRSTPAARHCAGGEHRRLPQRASSASARPVGRMLATLRRARRAVRRRERGRARPNRQHHALGADVVGPSRTSTSTSSVSTATRVPRVAERLGDQLRPDQYTVGMWAWELEEFPPTHAGRRPVRRRDLDLQPPRPGRDQPGCRRAGSSSCRRRCCGTSPPTEAAPLASTPSSASCSASTPTARSSARTRKASSRRSAPRSVRRGPRARRQVHNGALRPAGAGTPALSGGGRPDIHVIDAVLDVAARWAP